MVGVDSSLFRTVRCGIGPEFSLRAAMSNHHWIVSQIGAREHYAVARAFHRRQRLRRMYTDAWCRWGRGLLGRGVSAMRAIAGRWHADLPADLVTAFTWEAIRSRAFGHVFSRNRSVEEIHLDYIRVGRQFAEDVARDLARRNLVAGQDAFFGFDTGCLETLQWLAGRDIPTIVDQIDPARVEEDLVVREAEKWPGWQVSAGRVPEVYWQRLADEWRLATRVMVNSTWTKRALVQQGVAAEKILVVPLAYEPPPTALRRPGPPAGGDRPLVVLWLGAVLLRKGIQYLFEAARLLKGEKIRFVVAGGLGISTDAVRSAPPNVEFLGRVTRDRTPDLYRQADLFVLPTLSDGFGITQLEAMSYGLPVISTPNCGDVVSDGVDGLIVPPADAPALAAAIQRLHAEPKLRNAMSAQAGEKSRQFSLDRLADELCTCLSVGLPSGGFATRAPGYAKSALPSAVVPAAPRLAASVSPEREMSLRRWTVSQIGARQHYAVARAFDRQGRLRQLYTDAWCGWCRGLLRRGSRAMRGLAGRWHPDLPADRVHAFTWQAVSQHVFTAGDRQRNAEQEHLEYIRVGRRFAENVARHLARQELTPERDAFFGFDTGCLETLQWLASRGIPTVVDQIDPARVEEELVLEESRLWPNWQLSTGRVPEVYWRRLESEWQLATRVVVNSCWSRDALVQQGVPAEKIVVVPLAYEPAISVPPEPKPPRGDETLQVLWLGSVLLRKGIQYLIEAARLLEREKIEFLIAGPVGISADALRTAPPNMRFLGRITRDRVPRLYAQADAFVLPTLSDGFAITQIEALSHGLPVIATPNCGQVVDDGVDGLIVPVRDPGALAEAVARLHADPEFRRSLSRQARRKSLEFSLEKVGRRLVEVLDLSPSAAN